MDILLKMMENMLLEDNIKDAERIICQRKTDKSGLSIYGKIDDSLSPTEISKKKNPLQFGMKDYRYFQRY